MAHQTSKKRILSNWIASNHKKEGHVDVETTIPISASSRFTMLVNVHLRERDGRCTEPVCRGVGDFASFTCTISENR